MSGTSVVRAVRAVTPLGWAVAGGLAIVGLCLALGGLGFRWDPLDLSRRRAEAAEAAASRATAEAAARSAEARAYGDQVARIDVALRTTRSLDRATTQSIQEAKTAHDADLSLSSDRADRLREHDRELCRIAPDLAGCATAADPSRDGEPAL